LEKLRNTTEQFSQDRTCPRPDLIPERPKYKASLLNTRPRLSWMRVKPIDVLPGSEFGPWGRSQVSCWS